MQLHMQSRLHKCAMLHYACYTAVRIFRFACRSVRTSLWYPSCQTVRLDLYIVLNRQHVFPRLASLRPEACEAAMLLATRAILQLAAQDGTITAEMRRLVFVPTDIGGSRAPCELYDPR